MKNSLMKATILVICGVCSFAANAQTVNLQLQSGYTVGTANNTPNFTVGDVNNDGRPDLVTLNPNNLSTIGPISVFLNNGAGGYGSPINIQGDVNPFEVAIGDYNRDGNPDLAIAGGGGTTGLQIRLGNGTGNFPTGTYINNEQASPVIASADFNADGNLDVAICNSLNQLRVLPGSGTGAFGAAAVFTIAAACQDLVAADFNVDGRPDLAVAMRLAPSDRGIQIFLNNGANFNAPINVTASGATELAVADFNRDCIPDIAAAQFASSVINTPIFILIGNGAGGFTSTTVNVNNFPRYMTVGDFNRDKKVDLVLRRNINNSPTANNLTILPGNGAGGFGTPFEASIAPATSSTEMHVAMTDANLDGKDDLVIGRQGGFLLYHGNSNLSVRTENDFDADGKTDFGVFRPSLGAWYIQQSNQGFYAQQWGVGTDKLAPADYDGDYKTDVAVWREATSAGQDSIFYIFQSSNNTVRVERFGTLGDNPLVVGDWDGDGKADPAVYRNGGAAGAQSFFFYRPSATAGVGFRTVWWGINGDAPVRGDFDGDSRADAAVFRASDGLWYVTQSSNGQIRTQSWGLASDRRVPADYDGDGKTDFAVFRNGVWYILRSLSNTPVYRQWGLASDTVAPGDYNGDGAADTAVYRSADQRWYVPPCANYKEQFYSFGASGDVAVPAVNFP